MSTSGAPRPAVSTAKDPVGAPRTRARFVPPSLSYALSTILKSFSTSRSENPIPAPRSYVTIAERSSRLAGTADRSSRRDYHEARGPVNDSGGILSGMRALWLEDCRLRVRDDVPIPAPPSGEALVRVLRAGICNTDIELARGYYPFTGVLGHEFVGVVEQGPSALVGRRVVGEINAVCGACGACLAGRRTHCERRTVLGIVSRHGAFADYLILPAENLHPVPDAVPSDAAVFTEPLAAALEIRSEEHTSELQSLTNL